jgi:hypothetical protein
MLNVPCESGTCCARHVLDAARAQQRRDALEALHARPWVDVAEERVQHGRAANGSASHASFTVYKHRMHTPSWLMHESRPQAA